MRAVVEKQLAPAARIELEAVRDVHRPGLVDDDRVAVGPLRHFPGDAIRLERTASQFGLRRHERAQLPRPRAERPHLLVALRHPRLERRRQQVVHRRQQVLGPVRHIRYQRRGRRHDVADARRVVPHVDERRPARDDWRGRVVLELVADVDDEIQLGRIRKRLDAPAWNAAHPERMLLRKVRVHLARLRHRQRQELGKLHDLVERLRLVNLVADDE